MNTTLEELERQAREAGIPVVAGGRVSEADAAALLGYARGSLKNMRNIYGRAPKHCKIGGRTYYTIAALADWLDAQSEP